MLASRCSALICHSPGIRFRARARYQSRFVQPNHHYHYLFTTRGLLGGRATGQPSANLSLLCNDYCAAVLSKNGKCVDRP